MFYIHHTSCISPQQTFPVPNLDVTYSPVANKLKSVEPAYEGIPPGVLRRMSKVVRMGVGAAMPMLKLASGTNGIIIGTANAGMEDCFLFLKQIVDYEEGLLTPGNFVQSTPNAIAGQVAILTANKGYNITHVHLGHAFENAALDAAMLLRDHPGNSYLLGAVDDISSYNFILNTLSGLFKKEIVNNDELYNLNTAGTVAGEAAAMFLINGISTNATAQVKAIHTVHTTDEVIIREQLNIFLEKHLPAGEKINVFISGENGDNRLLKYYEACEELIPEDVSILRFKHLCGEYPTAGAFALWLACYILKENVVPSTLIKKRGTTEQPGYILIYNNYKGLQHSFMLVAAID